MWRSTKLIVIGLGLGVLAGLYLFDWPGNHFGPKELADLWERHKPNFTTERDAKSVPPSWMDNYRSAPQGSENEDAVGAVRFHICVSATRINCVVDGDTIWLQGEKIRISDIDTPEISKPRCASEEALGHQAKRRLLELLNAGPFQVVRSGSRNKDRYGRLLRVIERDGQSLGMILVSEGLAHVWDGRKHPWC